LINYTVYYYSIYLVNTKFKNSILNVKTLRGANIDSDYLILSIWIREKLIKHFENNLRNTGLFDIDKLEDQEVSKDFENSIKYVSQSKQIAADGVIDRGLEQIKETLNNVATRTLGRKKSKSKPWFNWICEETIRRRKLAR